MSQRDRSAGRLESPVADALTYVSDDVRCHVPDETVTTKEDWRDYLTAFVPMPQQQPA